MTTPFNNNVGDDASSLAAEVRTRWITKNEVAHHSDHSSCWIIINDFVYDVTEFLKEVNTRMSEITSGDNYSGSTANAMYTIKQNQWIYNETNPIIIPTPYIILRTYTANIIPTLYIYTYSGPTAHATR